MQQAVAPPPLQLRAADSAGMNPITGTITLEIGGESVDALLTASLTPAPFEALLPIFHTIAEELTSRGIARVEAAGQTLSCRAGCAACCRQPVPLVAAEARQIAALVAALPDGRRATDTARFAAARATIAAAGISTVAADIVALGPAGRDDYGRRYFRLGVACPFLDNENCTIHPQRPLSCREYLVTSPPVHCADLTDDTIVAVPLAGRTSAAVTAHGKEIEGHGTVMLVDALVWAIDHLAPPTEYSRIELALSTIARLPGRSASGA